MTTSGQTLQQTFDVATVFDHAARRCGVPTPALTPEGIAVLRGNLYLQFLDWGNLGVNLWCIRKTRLGLTVNKAQVAMPVGTIDVLNANRASSSVSRLTPEVVVSSDGGTAENVADGDVNTVCTQTATDGNLRYQYASSSSVAVVGVMLGAAGSRTLVFETSDDAVTWRIAKALPATLYADYEWVWAEIDAPESHLYFRVRESSGGILAVREFYTSTGVSEIPMSRLNRDEYTSLPNKNFPGDPLQFWFDRQITPIMMLWPTPRSALDHVVLWRHRHIEDPGAMTNDLEVPHRWFEAVTWDLAERAIFELPGADLNRLGAIQAKAGQYRQMAEDEERDNSPVLLSPNIRGYTR